MAVKNYLKRAAFLCAVLLTISGCMKNPGPFETVEDFRQNLSGRETFTAIPAGEILTLPRAIETALKNNPTNLAAAQSVLAAKYGYFRALSAYAPELNAGYSLGHTLTRGWDLKNPPVGVMKRNDHFITSGSIQATWLLFDGFARELEAVIAKQEYKKSMDAEENVKRLLVRAVAYAYYDMYLAGEEIIIYEEDLAFQNSALRQELERFRNGHVSKASVLNFQILAARARSNISNARYRKQVAFHALFALLGYDFRDLPSGVMLQKLTEDEQQDLMDENFYIELAVRYRPDLNMEKRALEIAWRKRQKAFADFFPELRLFSGFTLDTYDASYGGYKVSDARSRQGGFNYGIEGNWNLFRGFDTFNKVRQQEVLEKAAKWGLDAKFLEVVAEVRDAHSNCRNTRYQTEVFRSISRWVREQRDLVFSEYRNGRETITRLNEAQDMLVEAQNRLIVSRVEFRKAAIQLAAAAGIDIRTAVPEETAQKAAAAK